MRVPVTDLVGHPGETRPLSRTVERDELGDEPLGPAEGALVGAIALDLHLDAVVEGILVRGDVRFRLELPCARCLEPQPLERRVEAAELFVDPRKRDDGDEVEPGYEIVDDLTAIDLATMLRDAILVDLPVRVVCREDCSGLCPTCGADRNDVDCGHDHQSDGADPRWARLAEIEVPPA